MAEDEIRYRLSIRPAGTVSDTLLSIISKGERVEISGWPYTLRERWSEKPSESIRRSVISNLRELVRNDPTSPYVVSSRIRSASADENVSLAYTARFTLAEKIPPSDKDHGDHEYVFIKGLRYRLDHIGDQKKSAYSRSQIIDLAKDQFKAYLGENGEAPGGIEVGSETKESIQIGPFEIPR